MAMPSASNESKIPRVQNVTGNYKIRYCNRLDFPTSGLMVMAHSKKTGCAVQQQFEKRDTVKIYHAIVKGWAEWKELDIDAPLQDEAWLPCSRCGRAPFSGWPCPESTGRRCVAKNLTDEPEQAQDLAAPAMAWRQNKRKIGKSAESAFTRVWLLQRGYFRGLKCSLVKVQPFTGRRHQIRVHLAYAGHPILGDRTYCGEEQPPASAFRMFLHAYHLKMPLLGLSYTAGSGFAELIEPIDPTRMPLNLSNEC
eukprot:gnl/TRDRNA2_/TRDRNA2_151025_c0_seq1.p1 gnl/TRDRNA2_/TRDRNA2_151025_c0~~gnl/TRDRNA2_/TRDRNA2_151025_c0_seq1.p1  ORF type:complete len:252 (+),score=19.30 gnl/TRDRNA2_/TRDRNA2_151025_c0_seq1:33-788(+)